MSLVVDYKYASLLSNRLPQFKIKKTTPLVINSKCVICGDSQKSRKARFYIYERKGRYVAHCHNCGYHQGFGFFLKELDAEMYREYLFETFAEDGKSTPKEEFKGSNPVVAKNNNLQGLIKMSTLSHEHRAKKYIVDRQIPPDTHYRLFYTPHFAQWVNSKKPGSLYDKMKIDPRLVLPLLDRDGNCFGVQGRDLTGKSELRYITIRFDETFPKVFGLDKFNPNYNGYIVEGPIDSLFLPNALAMAGADIPMDEVIRVSNASKKRLVKVYDNEPRNKEMLKRVAKSINEGYNVCIWPSFIKQKDINDMVKAGLDPKKIIDGNTYSGLQATLELTAWRKD